jgi:hypothetical protein
MKRATRGSMVDFESFFSRADIKRSSGLEQNFVRDCFVDLFETLVKVALGREVNLSSGSSSK